MKPRFYSWLLMVALLWQSVLVMMPTTIAAQAVALEHALVHDEGVGHHHHDNASLMVEDLGSPQSHQHQDSSHFHALPWRQPDVGLNYPRATAPIAWLERGLPKPFLEAPLRPPRAVA